MVKEAKLEHQLNAPLPIIVTLLGMLMEVRLEQPEKAESPILDKPKGKSTDVKLKQESNTASPIVVKLLGMLMEVRLVQLEKAELSIFFTL